MNRSTYFKLNNYRIYYDLSGDFRIEYKTNNLVKYEDNLLTIGSSWNRLDSISKIKTINKVLLDGFRLIKIKNQYDSVQLICPYGKVNFTYYVCIDTKKGRVYSKI